MRRASLSIAIAAMFLGACATTPQTPEQAAQQAAAQAKLQAALEQFRCAALADSVSGSPTYNEWLATCPHGPVESAPPAAPAPPVLSVMPQEIQGYQNKVCVYHVMGNVETRSIPATGICPLITP